MKFVAPVVHNSPSTVHVCYSHFIDAENCLKPLDTGVWITAMTTHAHPPPPMSEDGFYMECHELVHNQFGLDLGSEVTAVNCIPVYQYLCANVYILGDS